MLYNLQGIFYLEYRELSNKLGDSFIALVEVRFQNNFSLKYYNFLICQRIHQSPCFLYVLINFTKKSTDIIMLLKF